MIPFSTASLAILLLSLASYHLIMRAYRKSSWTLHEVVFGSFGLGLTSLYILHWLSNAQILVVTLLLGVLALVGLINSWRGSIKNQQAKPQRLYATGTLFAILASILLVQNIISTSQADIWTTFHIILWMWVVVMWMYLATDAFLLRAQYLASKSNTAAQSRPIWGEISLEVAIKRFKRVEWVSIGVVAVSLLVSLIASLTSSNASGEVSLGKIIATLVLLTFFLTTKVMRHTTTLKVYDPRFKGLFVILPICLLGIIAIS